MPRPRLDKPSLRFHKPTGQGFIEAQRVRRYLGPYNDPDTRRKYELACVEYVNNGRSLTPTPDRFDCLALRVFAIKRAQIRFIDTAGNQTGSVLAMRGALRKFTDLYGPELAADFTAKKLGLLRDKLIGEGKSASHINKVLMYVRHAFDWAVEEGLVDERVAAPLDRVQRVKPNDPRCPKPMPLRRPSADDIKKVLDADDVSPVIKAMLELMAVTGMRVVEVARMTAGQIDRTNQACWYFKPTMHKNAWRGKAAVIPLGAAAQAIITPYLLNRTEDAPLFSPAESVQWFQMRRSLTRKTPRSCGNRPGTNRVKAPKRTVGTTWTTAAFSRAVARIMARLDVTKFTARELRKFFASEMEAKRDPVAAALMLNHASEAITEARYIVRRHEELAKFANDMPRLAN
ncbi:MAG: tyrosine-type recombinase/integrase [Tepidisphaeraceae bacterium]